MNNSVFGKTMENVQKHRGIKLITTEKRRNYLMTEPNHFTEMRSIQILMKKPVYLGLPTFDLSKTVMCEFLYDYGKPKYGEKGKKFYIDTYSFIVHVKTDDIYNDIAEDVEAIFGTSNYELEKPLPKGKNKLSV